ncbi:hypothetical protein [Mycobacterium asiaticum]|uniref:hypothetical protein n=1 Tax=Mycobacterium asiaticum TaxID=1790 RepID=UPI0007EF84B0|nr:hypothetical protein [Mycobacterium asiaticum]OBJ50198.1 hypothetical protein A9W94_28510 [Mycobacterium asiaticum]
MPKATPPTIERPYALVTWTGAAMTVKASYFATAGEAERAAPTNIPYTIVDLRRKPHPRRLAALEDYWRACEAQAHRKKPDD